MADFRGGVLNYLGGGDGVTTYADGSWTRNKVQFSCDGYDLELVLHDEIATGATFLELRGRRVYTADIIVRNVTARQKEGAHKVVDNVCWLLSFAGLSRTMCFQQEYLLRLLGYQGRYNSLAKRTTLKL